MRYCEIVPRNGSHYLIVRGLDGQPFEWSRHNSVKIAEQVRHQLVMAEVQRRYGQAQQEREVAR